MLGTHRPVGTMISESQKLRGGPKAAPEFVRFENDYRYRLFTCPQVALFVGVAAGQPLAPIAPPCHVMYW